MTPWLIRCLRAGLLLAFLFCAGMVLRSLNVSVQGARIHTDARILAATPRQVPQTQPKKEPFWVPVPVTDDPQLQAMAEINLAALRQVNPDVVGWIRIPDSEVDYPIVQGSDNEYYLTHRWDGKSLAAGAIALECSTLPDMTAFHTILYGHNMADGSMFASLRRYRRAAYWQSHPYVYLATDQGCFRYEVFSAYQAAVDGGTNTLGLDQSGEQEDYIQMAVQNTVIATGIRPVTSDRILTLSTCSGAGYETRWVVHARLKMVSTGQ